MSYYVGHNSHGGMHYASLFHLQIEYSFKIIAAVHAAESHKYDLINGFWMPVIFF